VYLKPVADNWAELCARVWGTCGHDGELASLADRRSKEAAAARAPPDHARGHRHAAKSADAAAHGVGAGRR
jgi:hypothetical protein